MKACLLTAGLFAMACQSLSAAGSTYYLRPTGNDNSGNGTIAAPWRTIEKAAEACTPGDTIHLMPGLYPGNPEFSNLASGTAGAPITIQGEAGAVIDGADGNGFWIVDRQHLRILDLEFRNCRPYGIRLDRSRDGSGCDHVTIRGCLIRGSTYAIYLRAVADSEVAWNDVVGCGAGIVETYRDNPDFGCHRNQVHHNLSHDWDPELLDADSADGIGGQACHNSDYSYNLVWNTGDDGIDISAPGGGRDSLIPIITPTNCRIHHNYVWKAGGGDGGDGNGIKVCTNHGGGMVVDHNVVFLNVSAGFDINKKWGELDTPDAFYCNIAYKNGSHGIALDFASLNKPGHASVLLNNIFARNGGSANKEVRVNGIQEPGRMYVFSKSDHNCFVGPTDTAAVGEGPNSLLSTDPRLANPDGAIDTKYTPVSGEAAIRATWQRIHDQVSSNFALQSTSPCRGRGARIMGINDNEPLTIGAIASVGASSPVATPVEQTGTGPSRCGSGGCGVGMFFSAALLVSWACVRRRRR